jgi:hypothetical protein
MWCSCHILSLFFNDYSSGSNAVPALRDALAKVKAVVNFIRDRQKPLAICRSHAKKEVILPGETRYGSAVLCICRIAAGLDWLDTTFSCTEYKG